MPLRLLVKSEGCDSPIEIIGKRHSVRTLVAARAWSDPHWVKVVELLGELLEDDGRPAEIYSTGKTSNMR